MHQYWDDNPSGSSVDSYSISAIVSDNDRGVGSATTTVQVSNLAPTLTLDDITAKSADGHVSVAGVYADVGTLDTHTAIVDWGDGTAPEPINLDELAGTVSGSHEYARGGVFPITITLTDDDGGTTTAITAATVQGVGVVGDTLYVIGTDSRDAVNISLYGANLRVQSRLGGGPQTTNWLPTSSVQSIFVLGCDGHDDIRLSAVVTQDATLDGGGGNDVLYTARGSDDVSGGPGNDTIKTYGGDDTVDGGDGVDRIWTHHGEDEIDAGDGNDYVYSGDDNDTVRAGDGNDLVQSGAGNDYIDAGDGNDVVRAGAGDDHIVGGTGDDRLEAGSGDDIALGGEGDDTIYGSTGRDILIAGGGVDRVYGGADDDLLIAGSTTFDTDRDALKSIRDEWTRSTGYSTRVADLSSGSTTSAPLNSANVTDDTALDRLYGQSGNDWFLASLSDTTDQSEAEALHRF
ncbi:MAG: calcium-binding protein [Rubripirellula sp.]